MSQILFQASFIVGHNDFEHAARTAGNREQPRRRTRSTAGHGQNAAAAGGMKSRDQGTTLGIHLSYFVVQAIAGRTMDRCPADHPLPLDYGMKVTSPINRQDELAFHAVPNVIL